MTPRIPPLWLLAAPAGAASLVAAPAAPTTTAEVAALSPGPGPAALYWKPGAPRRHAARSRAHGLPALPLPRPRHLRQVARGPLQAVEPACPWVLGSEDGEHDEDEDILNEARRAPVEAHPHAGGHGTGRHGATAGQRADTPPEPGSAACAALKVRLAPPVAGSGPATLGHAWQATMQALGPHRNGQAGTLADVRRLLLEQPDVHAAWVGRLPAAQQAGAHLLLPLLMLSAVTPRTAGQRAIALQRLAFLLRSAAAG